MLVAAVTFGPIRTLVLEFSAPVTVSLIGLVYGRTVAPNKTRGVVIALVGIFVLLMSATFSEPSATIAGAADGAATAAAAGGSGTAVANGAGSFAAGASGAGDLAAADAAQRAGARRLLQAAAGDPAAAGDVLAQGGSDAPAVEVGISAPVEELGAPSTFTALFVGLLVLLAAVGTATRRRLSKRLAADLGGRKRTHAITLVIAAGMVFPLGFFQCLTSWPETSTYGALSPSILASSALLGAFGEVFAEYLSSLDTTTGKSAKTSQPQSITTVSFAATLLSGVVLSLLYGDGQLGFVSFCSAVVVGVGLHFATAPAEPKGFAFGMGGSSGGGSSARGDSELPLYSGHREHGSSTLTGSIRKVMRHVMDNNDSRKIFIFLSINMLFMFVEVLVGLLTNSLGLISDAGHMFFDNASLFIGLYASYMAKWREDEVYTYGYARYEVLAGFVNAVFLVFIAGTVILEGLERLWEPPEVHGDHLLTTSIAGLLVNLVGVFFFHDAHAHGGHGHSHGDGGAGAHGHAHSNENMEGIFLHVLADTLGSVGVIVSSLLIQTYGWHLADPIASLVISVLIFLSVIPLLKSTSSVLLSRTPKKLSHVLQDALIQIANLPGVSRVHSPHFWTHHAQELVGTAHILVNDTADEQEVLKAAKAVLQHVGVSHVTLQVEKPSTIMEMAGMTGAETAADRLLAGGDLSDTVTFHKGMARLFPGGAAPGQGHGHSHGGDHGHSHGGDHGHSHGGNHGHSHGGDHARDHGHSHGGGHGHSHGGGLSRGDGHAAAATASGHGHSHGPGSAGGTGALDAVGTPGTGASDARARMVASAHRTPTRRRAGPGEVDATGAAAMPQLEEEDPTTR